MENSQPCVYCRARNYDRGRFHHVYGLCVYCFPLPDVRQYAADRWRCQQVDRRPADLPTDAGPGTPEKIGRLAFRLEHGLQLFHPDDKSCWQHLADLFAHENDPDEADSWDAAQETADRFRRSAVTGKPAGINGSHRQNDKRKNVDFVAHHIRPTVDPLPVDGYHRWIELDQTRGRTRYRARPRHRGCKANLGTFDRHEDAVSAVRQFLADTAPAVYLSTGRLPTVASIVYTTADGWYAVNWPTGYPRTVARSAARKLASKHASRLAADQAYRRLLRAEAASLKHFR